VIDVSPPPTAGYRGMFHLWPARSSLCNHHLLGGDPPAGRKARLPATLQLIALV
jgi:hypothetical protein